MFLSKEFGKASVAAFVHAIYPDILISHNGDTVYKIKEFEKRGCDKKINQCDFLNYKGLSSADK